MRLLGNRNIERGRLPNQVRNYPTAFLHGHLLCDWISKSMVLEPFDPKRLPFKEPRISPMSIVLKLNGAGSIVVDMSGPCPLADQGS